MINEKKRYTLTAIVIFAFLLNLSGLAADDVTIEPIVSQLSKQVAADPDLPGLSIAVLKKGESKPVTLAFGTARIENGVPMTAENIIKVGSITKVFTATLIHKLIEEGQLSYETTIDRFFPEFRDGKKIKIRHLLTHTSGMMEMLRLEEVYANPNKNWKLDDLIGLVGAKPPYFEPGTAQQYCNTGYLMLAQISEKVTGRSYEDQCREIFCKKLGMKSLAFGNDIAIVPKMAGGYTNSPETGLILPMMASISIAKGTGNLLATPEDVVKLVNISDVLKTNVFDSIPLTPLVLDNGKIGKAVIDNGGWNTTQSELDGCTLFEFDEPKIKVVGKLGSFPGFGTVYFYDRKTTFAVAISVNNEKKITNAMLLGAKILDALRMERR